MDEEVLAIQAIQGDQSYDAMTTRTPEEEHCTTNQKNNSN